MNGANKGVHGNYFHEMTLVALFTIYVNLHAMKFPLTFGETDFIEVPKSTKFTAFKERAPPSMVVSVFSTQITPWNYTK